MARLFAKEAKAAEFLASVGALLLLVLCILNLSQTGYNPGAEEEILSALKELQ